MSDPRITPARLPQLPPTTPEEVFGTVRTDPVALQQLPPASPTDVFGPPVRVELSPRAWAMSAEEMIVKSEQASGRVTLFSKG